MKWARHVFEITVRDAKRMDSEDGYLECDAKRRVRISVFCIHQGPLKQEVSDIDRNYDVEDVMMQGRSHGTALLKVTRDYHFKNCSPSPTATCSTARRQ